MKTRARLTERDTELLRFVGQHELATGKQLAAKFWAGRQERTAQERLEKLVKAGYLKAQPRHLDAQRQVRTYQATAKARKELTDARIYTGPVAAREVVERLKAVQVRLKLEEHGYVVRDWVSGRELQRSQSRQVAQRGRTVAIADGQAMVETEGGTATLEIEIDGDYWGKMLAEKVRHLSQGNKQVIWAVESARQGRVSQATAACPAITVWEIEEL